MSSLTLYVGKDGSLCTRSGGKLGEGIASRPSLRYNENPAWIFDFRNSGIELDESGEYVLAVDTDTKFSDINSQLCVLSENPVIDTENRTLSFSLNCGTQKMVYQTSGKTKPVFAFIQILKLNSSGGETSSDYLLTDWGVLLPCVYSPDGAVPVVVNLPIASALSLGCVKAGSGLGVLPDGTLYSEASAPTWEAVQNKPLGEPNGIPTLDENAKVPQEQLPEIDVSGAIEEHNEDPDAHSAKFNAVQAEIEAVEEKIPSAATAQNQLADKGFVNSSINNIAAFPITRDAQKDPFRTRAELLNATTYYSGGEVRVPTRNDYAFVQSDEYYGTAVEGYTDFALTEEYVGYYVLDGYEKTMVTAANKDDLGIVPGETVPYIELPSTRYIYNGTEFEFQFIVNNSGLTAAQWAAVNSSITAEKVAKYDGYNNGKVSLEESRTPSFKNGLIISGLLKSYDGSGGNLLFNGSWPNPSGYAAGSLANISVCYKGKVPTKTWLYGNALFGKFNVQRSDRPFLVGGGNSDTDRKNILELDWNGMLYSSQGMRTGVSTIPASTSAHTLSEGTFRHAPEMSPTYTLPAVTDTAVTHTIFLTVDMVNTASVVFQDSEGTAITPSLAGGTPAVGDVWQFMCEYSAVQSKWLVLGYKED